jgi:hypothetical protein
MGVTIHFEGALSSEESYDSVMAIATKMAEENGWEHAWIQEENKLLSRVKDEADWDYEGPVKGVQIQPDANTDPLILEFDENLYVQEYCKTQFADIEVHIRVVELLRQIEPYFVNLSVIDEGEYWESSDINRLQELIDDCFDLIEQAKKENPKLDGPFRYGNGRIIDLME